MGYFTEALMSYGTNAVLVSPNGEESVRIMLNPEYVRGEGYGYLSLGKVSNVRYRCIFDGGLDTEKLQDSILVCNGRKFDILSAEKFMVEESPSHIEAILKIREETYSDGN